jgi:hypothetical protein
MRAGAAGLAEACAEFFAAPPSVGAQSAVDETVLEGHHELALAREILELEQDEPCRSCGLHLYWSLREVLSHFVPMSSSHKHHACQKVKDPSVDFSAIGSVAVVTLIVRPLRALTGKETISPTSTYVAP